MKKALFILLIILPISTVFAAVGQLYYIPGTLYNNSRYSMQNLRWIISSNLVDDAEYSGQDNLNSGFFEVGMILGTETNLIIYHLDEYGLEQQCVYHYTMDKELHVTITPIQTSGSDIKCTLTGDPNQSGSTLQFDNKQ